MTRDLAARISEVVSIDIGREWYGDSPDVPDLQAQLHWGRQDFEEAVEIRRLALNLDQIDELDLLPQPLKTKNGKLSDSRAKSYITETGRTQGWELDALEPDYLADLIRGAVLEVRDQATWDEAIESEEAARANLGLAALSWNAPSRIRAIGERP